MKDFGTKVKKFVFLLLFFLLINFQVPAQWKQQISGVNENLFSLYFINDQIGWVIGKNGTILKTTDGGSNWSKVNLGYNNDLHAVYFVNENTGWIVGNDGLIFKTSDGGQNWLRQVPEDTLTNWDVFFADENHGWIGTLSTNPSNKQAKILRTTDGGQNWKAYTAGISNSLTLFFIDNNNGWAGGWGGDLARTNDGGITWSIQSSGTDVSRTSVSFVNDSVGWTVGGGGKITKTTDGGNSWFLLPFDQPVYINSVSFVNVNIGWMIGVDNNNGVIFKTTDGGNTWNEEFNLYDGNFQRIFFRDPTSGWTVGYNGFIAKYDTSRYVRITSPNGGEHWQVDSDQMISWEENNVKLLKLSYSTDKGESWMKIADSVDGKNGNFYWDSIPNTPSEDCMIRATDINFPEIYDLSDSAFTIYFNPSITVIAPNGGEKISREGSFDIKWSSQNVYSINILFSLNNGLSWEKITSNINSGGEYSWNTPDTVSDLCLIKIEDSSDTTVFDVSDQNFKISSIPRFSYFPLSPGNKWYFSYGIDGAIRRKIVVEKDTLMDDGYLYAKLNYYDLQTNVITEGYAYLRNDSDKVIRYPNGLFMDYRMQVGDTVDHNGIPAALSNINLEDVFGRYLSTYNFFFTQYDYYSFTDSVGFNTLGATTWYNYFPEYLLGCEIDGKVYGTVTSVNDKQKSITEFSLKQNYPNPFNPITTIRYQIPRTGYVSLKVYDLLGKEVSALVNEVKPAGEYNITFNGSNLGSGVYFYQLKSGSFVETKKLILMK